MLDNSIMCQAAKGSNCPLLENSIRCPLTHFDDDCPLANLLMLTADDKCPLADEEAHWLLR
jgi:hypothetical protein